MYQILGSTEKRRSEMADKNRVSTIKNMFVPEGVDDAMAEYLLAKCYELIKEAKNPTDKPPRTEVTETLRKYFNLDFSQIEAVMDYAYGKSQNRELLRLTMTNM